MKLWRLLRLLLLCAAAVAAVGGVCLPSKAVFSPQAPQPPIVVIDAGHGGTDGGAVSADGTLCESRLNLEIARRTALLLQFCGRSVVMTRWDEGDLADPTAETIREKKISDLRNRVGLIARSGADTLISIHQNSLPSDPRVCGAQVFYNTVPSAARLANAAQVLLNETVNRGGAKQCRPIGGDIYLMKEAPCAAILVECGFLTNKTDLTLLCTERHQMDLALAVAAGYLRYTSEEGTP